MPPVLNIKPEELDANEKRSKYTVNVVGCGQRGILYANAFADAGFKVICSDANPTVIKKVAKGKTAFPQQEIENKLKSNVNAGKISTSGELKKAVSQSDIIVISVAIKMDEQKKADNSELENVCKQVGAALQKGSLIIYCGISSFGFTEGAIKEALENSSGLKAGQEFCFAYTPIHKSDTSMANVKLTVAATDKTSLNAAATILKTLKNDVKEVTNVKTAEAAALFSVAKQDANTALANELAVFCEDAKVDYFEVLKILGINDPDFYPTIAEEENKKEVYLLLESADNLNAKLRLPALARQINEDMVKHAVNLTQDALRSCGKNLRRARVCILGAVNSSASMETLVKLLEAKGAKVNLFDPAKREAADSRLVKTSLSEAAEGTDCIVILSGPEQFKRLNLKKLKALMKNPSVIVDLTGSLEPQKVTTEGFIYCGLGKGTD
jgi:UDP-N-acetyl-D-mannosaminuronic acid dehydrogenase